MRENHLMVSSLFCRSSKRLTKTNKPYLNLILGDKTGQLEGRVWEPGDPRIARDFGQGRRSESPGSASRFDDRIQMKIDQLRVATPLEVDKADLLPSTTYDVAALWSQLQAAVNSVGNPDLKLLLNTILADQAIAALIARRRQQGSFITRGWAVFSSML